MKVLIQWTKSTPTDWIEIDSADWSSLSAIAKPIPTGGEVIDDTPGYIYTINVQGMAANGADHYHIEDLGIRGCRITMWADDLDDRAQGDRWAWIWTFHTLNRSANTRSGMNTDIEQETYLRGDYARFVPPTTNVIHGIWVTDEQDLIHEAAISVRGWREWANGD